MTKSALHSTWLLLLHFPCYSK